ncbi:hypothetical protein LSM04_003886 [Trypanosoma melophagium]|uniref:uncharacterized protein n=1 Tax=Trypanosoma melophagium TaxID=715481 RepID=UPI00351AA6D7|nr:hypothetical protein LSM04_003886 [Trypanosoma melophagium]
MSSEDSSTVSTSSLLEAQNNSDFSSVENANGNSVTTDKNQRKAIREQERLRRIEGKLTDISLKDIATRRYGKCDFFVENAVVCIRGSFSQFNAGRGKKGPMPPRTHDCCQTFSTVAAIILSSLGFAVTMQECNTMSTVNYLLYISAWLHQLSAPDWPQKKSRPTVGDLNTCLRLREFFPSKINEGEFEVLFYNQEERAKELVNQMCSLKHGRDADVGRPVCGYVIASGDYTVSIFSLVHDVRNQPDARYTEAWTLYICDSHGTQPWSGGKACLTGITLGVPKEGVAGIHGVLEKGEGLRYFTMILFALLEDHREKSRTPQQVPYMTWSPIRRKKYSGNTAQEMIAIIDGNWIPSLMKNHVIAREAKKFEFKPLKCFMGCPSTSATSSNQSNGARQPVVSQN